MSLALAFVNTVPTGIAIPEGIKQSFAVQAGREVRVIVQSEMFDDLASQKLARDIAKKIEDELDYPGQIKVTVVREFRTTEIAK